MSKITGFKSEQARQNAIASGRIDAQSASKLSIEPSSNVPITLPFSSIGTNPITTPTTPPATSGAGNNTFLESNNNSLMTQEEEDLKTLEKSKNTAGTDYLKSFIESSNTGQITEDIYKEQGVDVAKKQVDELTSQIEAEQLASRRRVQELEKNPAGMLAGGLSIAKNQIESESFQKQADMAIVLNASLRRYGTASAIADRQVEAKLEANRTALEVRKFIYEESKESWTKAEQRLYDAKIKKDEAALKKQTDIENSIKDLKMNVAQYAGSNAVGILSQLSKIDTTKTGAYDEAVRIAGKYASDPLDRQIKQATLNKLTATSGTEAPTTKEINGKTMQWDGKTWIEPPTGGTGTGDPVIVAKSLDEINTIKKLFNDNVSIGASAGIFQYGKIPFSNRLEDWRASTANVLAKLTATELARIKGTGVTFGALSEGERQLVADAASVLNQAKVWNGSGENKVWTGRFNISEKLVRQSFQEIQKYAELDFQKRTGMTTQEYQANQYINSIDPALQSITSPYADYIN